LKCAGCGVEIPDVARFCLSCGKAVPPPRQFKEQSKDDTEVNLPSIMLFMFAFMIFFFSIVPIFLGLWIGAAIMGGIGLVLVLAGYGMWRSNKKEVQRVQEKAEERAKIKIKCRYCGSLNEQDSLRCISCGATL
jgi:uncharacterized membrane protein YvbJ